MAFSWQGLYTALETAVKTAWPEVRQDNGGGGVWEADRTARIDFERLPGLLNPPAAVIAWGEIAPAESPITAKAYDARMHFLYLTDLNPVNGIDKVRLQLDALEVYLLGTGLAGTDASVLAVEGYDWSPSHEVNQKILELGLPLVAGVLTATIFAGES